MTAEEYAAEIRAVHPDIEMRGRAKQTADGWEATFSAGYRHGAFPMWAGRGATRGDALARAASHAHHYWLLPANRKSR